MGNIREEHGNSSKQYEVACRCNCGYTCARTCGLEIMECIKLHWKQDCDHIFDGPVKHFNNGGSVTCSKCGITAIDHDCIVGP